MDVTGKRVINPSKLGPWDGGYDAGARFSRPQMYWLSQMNIDTDTVETMQVQAGVETYLCPVIARAKRLPRVKIIATGGDRMWVDAK